MIKSTNRAKSIFLQAIELESEDDRRELIDQACGKDLDLHRDVQSLLAHADQLGDFMDHDSLAVTNVSESSNLRSAEVIGSTIGPYKIHEQIGEGGMGLVYVAEQTEPVRRKVALKIIRAGMSSKEILARFEAERQALAMMDHPNIARVLDGGSTPDGQPYFVMELVLGLPITEFADAHRLSIQQRLEVFVKVCRAVQHAHQKGIIHRDLKPSNLLVAEIDDEAVPKVIDFGLAKALSQQLTNSTLYTRVSTMLGTPMYMSPEQASMGVIDVDTRSDVYSLGVLLYELLIGDPPFDRDTFKSVSFDEIRRIIRDVEPTRPSAKLSTLQARKKTTLADSRQMEARRLNVSLKGELDWVVMKALEKDRRRRYESASALADDVQRYLAGEQVQACPPSTSYRLSKFVTRNKAAITTVSLIICSLLLGTVVSVYQMFQAQSARKTAESALQTAEDETEKATAATKESEANLTAAFDAIERLLEHSSNPELAEIPNFQAVRMRMLSDALAFYDDFNTSSGKSSEVRYRAAMTRLQLGNLKLDFREWEEGPGILQPAVDEFQRLVDEHPKELRFREGLAEALGQYAWSRVGWHYLGDTERLVNAVNQMMPVYEQQQLEYERLIRLNHTNRSRYQLAALEYDLDRAHAYKKKYDNPMAVSVTESVREALRDQDPEPGSPSCRLLARASTELARMLIDIDPDRARVLYLESIELGRTMVTEVVPREARAEQTDRLNSYVRFLKDHGDGEDLPMASANIKESLQLAVGIVKQYPNVRQYALYLDRACSLSLQVLERRIDLARTDGNDGAAKTLSDEMKKLTERIATDFGIHKHLALLQAQAADNHQQLSESIERYPNQYAYHYRRGDVHKQQGNVDQALVDYSRAIDLQPLEPLYPYNGETIHMSRGDLYVKMGDYVKAIADYDHQLSHRGAVGDVGTYRADLSSQILKRRGFAHFQVGNFDSALADISAAVELNPKNNSVLFSIPLSSVVACTDLDFRTGLLEIADRAVELNKRSAESLLARASLLRAFGDIERWQADIESVMPQLPIDADTFNNVAWEIAVTDDAGPQLIEQANKLAQETVSLSPENPSYWNTLGVVQYRLGHFDAAITSLEKSEELSGGEYFGYNGVFLALSYHRIGDDGKSQDFYDRTLAWKLEHGGDVDLDHFISQAAKVLGPHSGSFGR